jgi:hypothetical protein
MSGMLKALLVGILAVTATGACSSKRDTPQVDPAAPAGKVLEVSGAVTVGAKPLAVGDTIKANDLIETGADGSVVIRLAHNDARWELGPNRKTKPTESPAWTAERSTGPAKPVEQDTSAAGRPAERSAADTSTSVGRGAAAADENARNDSSGGAKEAPSTGSRRAPSAAVTAAPAPSAAQPPPTAQPSAPAGGEPPPPPAPPPPPPPVVQPQLERSPAPKEVAKEEPIQTLATLSTCLPKGQTVKINVHITNHVPAIKFEGAVDAKVKSCITTAAKKLLVSVETGDMSISLRN